MRSLVTLVAAAALGTAAATTDAAAQVRIERLLDRPIIRPDMDASMGSNIAGPSLIRVPDWITDPLGRYYLYFADHRGTYIRLAYADALTGPWTTHEPGALQLDQSHFPATCPPCSPEGSYAHIASPDVHVDDAQRRIVMYVHGRDVGRQATRAAVSTDGVHFRGTGRDSRPSLFPGVPLRRFRLRAGDARRVVSFAGRAHRLRGGSPAVSTRTCVTPPFCGAAHGCSCSGPHGATPRSASGSRPST